MIKELFKTVYKEYGKEVSGYEMENGEHRFRLSSTSSAYIRTESNGKAWQRSHFHTEQTEFFLVEKGEVLFVMLKDGEITIQSYGEGDFFAVQPMIPHNMCLSEGGITHTVKMGGKPDWNGCQELDELIKGRIK